MRKPSKLVEQTGYATPLPPEIFAKKPTCIFGKAGFCHL
jgi:hypothetical protein